MDNESVAVVDCRVLGLGMWVMFQIIAFVNPLSNTSDGITTVSFLGRKVTSEVGKERLQLLSLDDDMERKELQMEMGFVLSCSRHLDTA